LRSPDIDDADSAVTRLLVLGDSFAFGWGVTADEAFPRRLEALLRERLPGRRVEVIDGGVPGYSPYQEKALLLRLVDSCDVDAVVSTFSLANDMVDEARVRRFAPDRLADYSPQPLDPDGRLARLLARSRALTWLDLRTRAAQFQVLNVLPGSVRCAEESLDGIAAVCRERRIPLLLVLLPRRMEVAGGGLESRVGAWMTRGARRMHASVAARGGLPVVDVTPALRKASASESVFLTRDPHWTPAGHDAAARAMLDACLDLLRAADPTRSVGGG
jgi:hypothetical protein